jgi:transposase InsO family protein
VWPGIRRAVRLFIAACEACGTYQKLPRKPRAELGRLQATAKFDVVAVDVFGGRDSLPLSVNGNRLVLVAIDLFTRYAVGVPLPDQRAETVANAILHNWILVFGPPKNLHSDQGTNFESDLIQNLCAAFRIGKSRTTPFNPQGNGACERRRARAGRCRPRRAW